NHKEQELLLKEKSLHLKEEDLARREKLLESSSKKSVADSSAVTVDSLAVLHPELAGTWNVTMRCTETSCAGSAVGDTKNEQCVISYKDNTVIANAISDNKIVRVYAGSSNDNSIELSTQPDTANPEQKTKMVVRLQVTKENEMAGQREIIHAEGCRIVYSLDLKKSEDNLLSLLKN
ncbi:MAG TPA: hypothetical protein VF700_11770, partial [Segetibacter sp.]